MINNYFWHFIMVVENVHFFLVEFLKIYGRWLIMLDHNDIQCVYLSKWSYIFNVFYVILNTANRHKNFLSISQRSFLLFFILTNGQNKWIKCVKWFISLISILLRVGIVTNHFYSLHSFIISLVPLPPSLSLLSLSFPLILVLMKIFMPRNSRGIL